MKTAILISGHMRSFRECLPNLRWMLFRRFPGADVFASTVPDGNEDSVKLLEGLGVPPTYEIHSPQPEFVLPAACPAKWNGPGKPYMHEPYAISVSPQAVLGQLWQLQNVWELYARSSIFGNHDLVIRLRPDLWFHDFKAPEFLDRIEVNPGFAFCPWWGKFGGVNDRFALLGRRAAMAYFTTFSKVSRLIENGAPLHPESLVRASLEESACTFHQLDALFSTRRPGGEMRPPEILASDIAGR